MSRNKTVFAKTRSGQDMKASIVIFLKTLLCIVEELEPLPSTVFLKIQVISIFQSDTEFGPAYAQFSSRIERLNRRNSSQIQGKALLSDCPLLGR